MKSHLQSVAALLLALPTMLHAATPAPAVCWTLNEARETGGVQQVSGQLDSQHWAIEPVPGVRDGDWKLIEWYEDSRPELFNLRDDLEEKHNVAAANPAKVKELQAKLAAGRQEVGAVMPTPNPKLDPNAKPAANIGKKAE